MGLHVETDRVGGVQCDTAASPQGANQAPVAGRGLPECGFRHAGSRQEGVYLCEELLCAAHADIVRDNFHVVKGVASYPQTAGGERKFSLFG